MEKILQKRMIHNIKVYDQAKQLKNVNYIGYKPNSYIKEHLKDYQMFVYPSIWEETSCISAIDCGSFYATPELL